jgi:hypothetical protein
VLPSYEPPSADPHARWCGEGGLNTRPYPISCFEFECLSPTALNIPFALRVFVSIPKTDNLFKHRN